MAYAESKLNIPEAELGPEAKAEDLYQIGLIYSTGTGVEADFVLAHKFFNLTALRGYEDAKQSRKDIAEYMSSEEIAEAQRSAREWLKLAN